MSFTVIKKLQERRDGKDYKSEVWLVRDQDGLFKVLKSFVDYTKYDGYLNEDKLVLPETSCFPRYYGITKIKDKEYIRRSFVGGQLLADYGRQSHSKKEVCFIIADIAKKLQSLENSNLLFLDLRPENVLVTPVEVRLFDLGLCRYKDKDDFFKPIVSHPRYTAPEIVKEMHANSKSIVFQLGVVAYELLYGRHPFDNREKVDFNLSREWEYGEEHYLKLYMQGTKIRVHNGFIQKMLSYDIDERPSLGDCIKEFSSSQKQTKFSFIADTANERVLNIIRKDAWKWNKKVVLFPARMGISHVGHIDFMTALLDLGFKLVVSIQRAYTLTDDDLIPKWLILKMVARSLLEAGYPEESFSFYLTPFYATEAEFRMHFSMLPKAFDFVASSNETIARYFPGRMICQKDVLGYENIHYEDRSWGKIIRDAVKKNNEDTFRAYAASGVCEILTFDEIRECKQRELFVFSKNVFVELLGLDGERVVLKSVSRYSTPELSLGFPITDQYSKHSKIEYNGMIYRLAYDKTLYEDNKCTIVYRLVGD